MTLTPKVTIFIILTIAMFLLSFVLQGLISKHKNPWFGLVLPMLSFILALFWGIGRLIVHRKLGLDIILKDFLLFSAFNFATIIHLIIYFISRKIKPKKETDDEEDSQFNGG